MRLQVFSVLLIFLVVGGNPGSATAQTKIYATGGFLKYQYYHKNYYDALPPWFAGIEVDQYIGYHYAITSGLTFFQAGYNYRFQYQNANITYNWSNRFIQVPIGIKLASQGDVLGIQAGVNFNYLVTSTIRELSDSLNNYSDYITTNVAKGISRVQPDFYFGILVRFNRLTCSMKLSYSLTNRYFSGVRHITDQNTSVYKSYYAYALGVNEGNKLKATGTQLNIAIRLF